MDLITRQALPGVVPLRISYHGFLGAIWAGVAISGIVLACRLYSRFRGPRRLFWDDPFAIFAFALILITGALWQWGARDMYYVINVQAGIETYEPDFFVRLRRWLLVSLIVEIFFYTSLLSIKLSFLFFFRRLGNGVSYFKYIWWPVMLMCFVNYLVSMGDIGYSCLVGPTEHIIGECNSLEKINAIDITLKVNCALDVFTDFLIMLLPTTVLWKVRIRWSKKIAIFCLFSLSIITIVIAIVRVATIQLTKRPDGNDDVSYLWFWSALEPAIALVVSCLSAFPHLFAQSTRNKKPSFTPSATYLQMISRIRAKKRGQGRPWDDLTDVSQTRDLDRTCVGPDTELSSRRSHDSREPVLVPKNPRPTVYAYTGPSDESVIVPENQIAQKFEFRVTKQ